MSDKLVRQRLDERIAQLEQQAEQIQAKLEALRAARAEFEGHGTFRTAGRKSASAPARRTFRPTVRPRKGHTGALATALQILDDAGGKELHITEIVRQLGEMGIEVRKPLNLQSGLSRQVRKKRLIRRRRGWFAAPVRSSDPRQGNAREENRPTLMADKATAH